MKGYKTILFLGVMVFLSTCMACNNEKIEKSATPTISNDKVDEKETQKNEEMVTSGLNTPFETGDEDIIYLDFEDDWPFDNAYDFLEKSTAGARNVFANMVQNNQMIDNFNIAQSIDVLIDDASLESDTFRSKYDGYLYGDLLFEDKYIVDNFNNRNDSFHTLLKTKAKEYYVGEIVLETSLKNYTTSKHKLLIVDEYAAKQGISKDEAYGDDLNYYTVVVDGSDKEYILVVGNEGTGRYPSIYMEEKQGDTYVTIKEYAEVFEENWGMYGGASGNYVKLIEYDNKLYLQSSFYWGDYKESYFEIKYNTEKEQIYLENCGEIQKKEKAEKAIFKQTFIFSKMTDVNQANDFSDYVIDMVKNDSFKYGISWNGNGSRARWNDDLNLEIRSFEYDINNTGKKETIQADHRFLSRGYSQNVSWRIGEEYFCENSQADSESSLSNISPFFTKITEDRKSNYNFPYYFGYYWQLYVETIDGVDYLVSWNTLNQYDSNAEGYVVTAYEIGSNQSLTPVYTTYIFLDSEFILTSN